MLLANQDYSICIRCGEGALVAFGVNNTSHIFRTERTYCSICYWSTSFGMSVPGGAAANGLLGIYTKKPNLQKIYAELDKFQKRPHLDYC